jgi:hypothetical protein
MTLQLGRGGQGVEVASVDHPKCLCPNRKVTDHLSTPITSLPQKDAGTKVSMNRHNGSIFSLPRLQDRNGGKTCGRTDSSLEVRQLEMCPCHPA